jgi:hypothetical protein
MAMRALRTVPPESGPANEPLLEPGDRLSRPEFERRYERMPHLKKAEHIERTVFMPSKDYLRSQVFPGLWLDPKALLNGDLKTVLAALREGLASPEHRAFAAET